MEQAEKCLEKFIVETVACQIREGGRKDRRREGRIKGWNKRGRKEENRKGCKEGIIGFTRHLIKMTN